MIFGLQEAIVLLVIVLLIFGPKRLPQLAKALGTSFREFKEAIEGISKPGKSKKKKK